MFEIRIRSMIAAVLLATLLFGAWVQEAAHASSVNGINITIREDGVVVVNLSVTVDTGLNKFQLPAEPIVATITVNVNGSILPIFYSNNTLYLPSDKSGTGEINYLVKVETSGRSSWFTINTNKTVWVDIAPNIILIGSPKNVINATIEDGHLLLVVEGPLTLNYTITEATGTNALAATTTSGGQGLNTGGRGLPSYTKLMIIIIFILIVLLSTIYILRRKQSREGSGRKMSADAGGGREAFVTRELDATDWSIIRYLRDRGGEAYQYEIRYALKIPKATLSRRIGKLAGLGLVEVVREGKVNKIILKDNSVIP